MAGSSAPSTATPRRRPIGSWVFATVLAVGALLMAGETVRRTLAHRYAERDPALALAWDDSDVAARENLANHRLAAAMSRGDPAAKAAALREARAEATRVLAAGPLHWAALRDLGLAADISGDGARAAAIMTRAALRGHRDVATQGWWLQRSLASGDAPGAVARLDAILRTQPDLEPRLFPVMAAVLAAPAARPAWVRSLVADPPWRQGVLDDFALEDPDLDAVGQLFEALEARRSAPSDGQLGVLLTRIAAAGRYVEARAIWTRSVGTAGAAAPYDGNFGGRRGSPPFNWRIVQPDSGATGMETRPGVGSVLAASYPSNDAPMIAEQLLTLAPGAYRLSGRWRVEQPASGAAVSWTLTCAANGSPMAEWRHGADLPLDWTAFDIGFAVPTGCQGQWLRLQGRAGDGFGVVATAFTALRVEPATR